MTQKEVDRSLQMTIYALAAVDPGVYKYDPGKVILSFYFFEGQKKISTHRTSDQLKKAAEEIIKIRNKIQESDFQPKTNYLCRFCNYQLLCNTA